MSTADGTVRSVGIVGGTGPQGRGLGLRLAAAGHRVVLGSRDTDRGAKTAHELATEHAIDPGLLTGGGNDDAAACEVVVAAVPFDGVADTVAPLRAALADKVVISCINRLGFDGSGPHPLPVDEGSAAELVATLAPGARVVGAFHHVPAGRLRRTDTTLDMDVLIVGDDDAACTTTKQLADAIPGARGVRCGPLRLARPLEEMTAVVLSVNKRYKVTAGTRLTGLGDDAG